MKVRGGPAGWDSLVRGTREERWIGPKEKSGLDVRLDRERY
jgi:hypothetical protein